MKSQNLIMLGVAAGVVIWGGKTAVTTAIDLKNASENELKYAPVIAAAEARYGIPKGMLHRLIRQESAFRTDIITGKKKSPAGALGIAQFMPATARQELGSVDAALNPTVAIDGAGRYLKKLHGIAGNWQGAVAAYNWGIGNVQRKGLARMPAETRNYVAKIWGPYEKTA